jgi:hypothetical protein
MTASCGALPYQRVKGSIGGILGPGLVSNQANCPCRYVFQPMTWKPFVRWVGYLTAHELGECWHMGWSETVVLETRELMRSRRV